MPATASFDAVQCPLFQEMTPDEKAEVLRLFEHLTYPPGETIIVEGRAVQMLWIIVRGECEVVKATKNGQQRLEVLGPGHVFGEMSFFHAAPHSASVRAISEVEVMRLPREKYDELVQQGSSAALKIAASMASVLAKRLRRMDEWTFELVNGTAGQAADKRQEWREFRSKLYSEWDF